MIPIEFNSSRPLFQQRWFWKFSFLLFFFPKQCKKKLDFLADLQIQTYLGKRWCMVSTLMCLYVQVCVYPLCTVCVWFHGPVVSWWLYSSQGESRSSRVSLLFFSVSPIQFRKKRWWTYLRKCPLSCSKSSYCPPDAISLLTTVEVTHAEGNFHL